MSWGNSWFSKIESIDWNPPLLIHYCHFESLGKRKKERIEKEKERKLCALRKKGKTMNIGWIWWRRRSSPFSWT